MVNNKHKKHQCPCCEYFTLNNKANNTFQICPVCYWEDDGVQMLDPTYIGGANAVSLMQAKENFKKIGAVEQRFIYLVRRPLEEEKDIS